MTEDRRTKAQILEQLATAEKRIDELDNMKSVTIEPPARVPEAEALAGCVRAIDRMVDSSKLSSNGYGNNYSVAYNGDYPRSQTAAERVLRLLAAKYSVPLVEVRTEPCGRRHLDEINPDRIMQALHA